MFSEKKQTSISNNKIITYLVYALGEVLIVIIGVLIAIAFNNYNNASNADDKSYKYILNIKNDLLDDLSELEKSFNTTEKQSLLLDRYFSNFKNLEVLSLADLQQIHSISIQYPYNNRVMTTYLSTNQNSFSNASQYVQDILESINVYYDYCKVLDHSNVNSRSLYDMVNNYWIRSEIDINSDEKKILIEILSSNNYKNLLYLKKSTISFDQDQLKNCIVFNKYTAKNIDTFLITNQ